MSSVTRPVGYSLSGQPRGAGSPPGRPARAPGPAAALLVTAGGLSRPAACPEPPTGRPGARGRGGFGGGGPAAASESRSESTRDLNLKRLRARARASMRNAAQSLAARSMARHASDSLANHHDQSLAFY